MCQLCSDPNHIPDREDNPTAVSRRQVLKAGAGLVAAPLLAGLFPAARALAAEARVKSKGYALFASDGKFKPYEFTRHPVGDHDVLIDILYAGICHSDIHSARRVFGQRTALRHHLSRSVGDPIQLHRPPRR